MPEALVPRVVSFSMCMKLNRHASPSCGQFSTDDIAGFLGLPPTFSGSMTVSSDAGVVVFNQERTSDNTGAVVPVHPR